MSDEEIRILLQEYAQTKDLITLLKLISSLKRSGRLKEAAEAEFDYLEPYLKAYDQAWHNVTGYMQAWAHNLTNTLLAAKTILTLKAKDLNLSPAHHVYRRYDIPDTNNHIRKIAVLHNAIISSSRAQPDVDVLYAYTGRDDDSYFGDCTFPTLEDAENFKRDLTRHHDYFGEEAQIINKDNQWRVSWNVGK